MTNTKTNESLAAIVGKGVVLTALNLIYTFYGAWVLTLVWGWFAVAILGAPPITLVMAIAIQIIRGALLTTAGEVSVYMVANEKLEDNMKWVQKWFGSAIVSTAILMGGAFWHFIILPIFGLV